MSLTDAQAQTLRDEIANDPRARGYSASFPDAPGTVADMLNALTETAIGPLRSTTAKSWAATGPYARVVDASNDATSPFRASCLVLRDSFASGDMIHMEDAAIRGMFDKWVIGKLITQAEHDALIALATVPASRAQVLGLPFVTVDEVIAAWQS